VNERLRIMHAIRSHRFAGVEQFVLRLAVAQAAAGHDVTVVGGARESMAPTLSRAGVAFESGDSVGQVIRAVRRGRSRTDVVNTHMTAADGAAVVALRTARVRPPIVSTRHFAHPRGSAGPVRWDALLAGRIDAEIAISAAVAAATGLPSTIVRTGLSAAPVLDDQPDRSRTILMAQRLQPEKHTAVGVRAFAASGLAADGWELLIAGDGPERDELQRLAGRLEVDDAVRLLGFRSDIPDLMRRSSLFLATCPNEGLGIAVLEAMSQGLPIVAAGAAGHLELLEGLDPRSLFVPDDAADAGRALRGLAADAGAREALANAAAQRQREQFSLDAQVRGTDAVYRSVLDRRGA
jgi:glycosyltransferase involved in cell wall biosynthesis